MSKSFDFRALSFPLIITVPFWALGALLWHKTGDIFFLFNFLYIGTALGLGIGLLSALPGARKALARKLTLILIGGYMLGYLGIFSSENMQLEGFFFYLLQGTLLGSVLHYLIAKIIGPLLFNRAWCGWACWTAMVLDLLPYAESGGRVNRGWEKLRYLHFALSAALVAGLFFIGGYRCESGSEGELWWLVSGNVLYYGSAVILAWVLGDNRAFCKYLCPVAPVLKLGARFSLLKVAGSRRSCTLCGRCAQHCPMNIRVFEYVRRGTRVLSTECVLCLECLHACPTDSLDVTFGFDLGGREYIKRRP